MEDDGGIGTSGLTLFLMNKRLGIMTKAMIVEHKWYRLFAWLDCNFAMVFLVH